MSAPTNTRPAEQGEGDAGRAQLELDETTARWVAHLRQLDEQIKTLEEAKKHARQQIEAALGEHEVGLVDGQPAVRWTYVHSSRLDQRKLKEQDPILVEACTVPTVTRRFTPGGER